MLFSTRAGFAARPVIKEVSMAVLGTMLLCLFARGQSVNAVEEITDSVSAREMAAQAAIERRQTIENFQQEMAGGIPEQKQAAADSLRAAMSGWLEEEAPIADSRATIADLKEKAAGDAKMLAFLGRLEKRREDQLGQERKINLMNEAVGEQKQQLLDEFRADLEAALENEREEQGEAEPSGPLPPERAANLSKSEQRMQDYRQMLTQADAASPSEKAEIFDQWRERMEAELSKENSQSVPEAE